MRLDICNSRLFQKSSIFWIPFPLSKCHKVILYQFKLLPRMRSVQELFNWSLWIATNELNSSAKLNEKVTVSILPSCLTKLQWKRSLHSLYHLYVRLFRSLHQASRFSIGGPPTLVKWVLQMKFSTCIFYSICHYIISITAILYRLYYL